MIPVARGILRVKKQGLRPGLLFRRGEKLVLGFRLDFCNTVGLGDVLVLLLLWGLMVAKFIVHTAENRPMHVSDWFGGRPCVVMSDCWLWVCCYLCFMWKKQGFHGLGGVRPRQNAVLGSKVLYFTMRNDFFD